MHLHCVSPSIPPSHPSSSSLPIPRRCQLCDLVKAQAWGLGHSNWMERRCNKCWAEDSQKLANIRHFGRTAGGGTASSFDAAGSGQDGRGRRSSWSDLIQDLNSQVPGEIPEDAVWPERSVRMGSPGTHGENSCCDAAIAVGPRSVSVVILPQQLQASSAMLDSYPDLYHTPSPLTKGNIYPLLSHSCGGMH